MMFLTVKHSDNDNNNFNIIFVLTILSLTFSMVGNLKQIEEIYPECIRTQRGAYNNRKLSHIIREIPSSFVLTWCSDVLLCIYGFYVDDYIIALYGMLNSCTIIFVLLSIKFESFSQVERNTVCTSTGQIVPKSSIFD